MLNNNFKSYHVEAWDILQHLFKVNKINDHTLHFVGEFSGKLDLERLRQAVDISIDAFPLIRCVYNETKRKPFWEDKGYTADDVIEYIEAQDADEEMIQHLYQEIDGFNGPQLRIKVIQREEKHIMCVLINHMLCDAAGFKDYLYMLSDIYTNMDRKLDYSIAAMGNRKIKQVLKVFSIPDKLKIMFSKINMSVNDNSSFNFEGDLDSPFIEFRKIDKEKFLRLKAFAKKHEATINDVMLTAYMRVLFQIFGKALSIPCAIDLRKYLLNHKAEGICNLPTNIFCNIGSEVDETFEQTIYKVKQVMDKQKNDISCVKSLIMLEKVFDIFPNKLARNIIEKNFSNPLIAFTNIGIIDKKRIVFGEIEITEAFMTGSIKYSPYFQLAVSTFADKVTLSVNLYGTKADRIKVSDFLDKFIGELQTIM
jgi:NRPS condensation-like uncharacterized protein